MYNVEGVYTIHPLHSTSLYTQPLLDVLIHVWPYSSTAHHAAATPSMFFRTAWACGPCGSRKSTDTRALPKHLLHRILVPLGRGVPVHLWDGVWDRHRAAVDVRRRRWRRHSPCAASLSVTGVPHRRFDHLRPSVAGGFDPTTKSQALPRATDIMCSGCGPSCSWWVIDGEHKHRMHQIGDSVAVKPSPNHQRLRACTCTGTV